MASSYPLDQHNHKNLMHDTITHHHTYRPLQILNWTNSRHGTLIGRCAPTHMCRWDDTCLLGASRTNPGSSGDGFPSQSHSGPLLRLRHSKHREHNPRLMLTKESCYAEKSIKTANHYLIFMFVTVLLMLSAQYRSPISHMTGCKTSPGGGCTTRLFLLRSLYDHI
ncbi:hypothetical protein LZ31DRAFT_157781 [Colletotrichum somersetense]|nr:hypothetical protein LZ31DRAFT_157781 [Colletotrichum somersetense]